MPFEWSSHRSNRFFHPNGKRSRTISGGSLQFLKITAVPFDFQAKFLDFLAKWH